MSSLDGLDFPSMSRRKLERNSDVEFKYAVIVDSSAGFWVVKFTIVLAISFKRGEIQFL